MNSNKLFQDPPIYAYDLPAGLLEPLESVEKYSQEAEDVFFFRKFLKLRTSEVPNVIVQNVQNFMLNRMV
jgi:hypothetical protein